MPRTSRPLPVVGMPVLVMHFGASEPAAIEAIADGGRTVVVNGCEYTLRRLTGHYVREGEPYYGSRLILEGQR